MIEELIESLIKNPTEELKETYLNFVNTTEYSLLEDAETLPFRSPEYFEQRKQAFAYRRECATILLQHWVATHGTSKDCPVNYTDTLNIPFQQIKKPK
jgi:hypothetical protein